WLPRVAPDHMPRLYASAAASGGALVITSDLENFPMTVVEATMQGCPVVGPAVGGLPELLPAAALFEAGDEEAAQRLVAKVVSEPGAGATLAASARAIIDPLVRPERALAAYLAALDSAL